jgi:EPS-associated MarR family transcriptional regulator
MKPNDKPTKSSAINLQVLSRLQDEPRVSQRGLASDLGVSLGGVNYCLKALISKGFVKAENFSKSSNKLGYAYLLTASGIREKTKLTSLFLKRKRAEYSRLEQEIAELEAQLAQELADKAEAGV